MNRKVKIRSWESMEKEFGIDETGDIDNPQSSQLFVEDMKPMCGKIVEVDIDNQCNGYGISDWMIESEEPTIMKKSIQDFPLVEVTNNKGFPWNKRPYITHLPSGGVLVFRDSSGFVTSYKYMRPIKPVNVAELKQKARLV